MKLLFETLKVSSEIRLRIPKTSDHNAFFELIYESNPYLSPWLDWPNKISTPQAAVIMLREMMLFNQGGQKFFSFLEKNGQLVGSIALMRIDPKNFSAEVGFWKSPTQISPQEMRSVGHAFCQACFEKSFLKRLSIRCRADNQAAIQFAKDLGFDKEGQQKAAIFHKNNFYDQVLFGKIPLS